MAGCTRTGAWAADRPRRKVRHAAHTASTQSHTNAVCMCSIITGTEGNPIVALCRQLGVDLHELRDVCPIYNPDGSAVDPALDERVELHFNLQLEKSKQVRVCAVLCGVQVC